MNYSHTNICVWCVCVLETHNSHLPGLLHSWYACTQAIFPAQTCMLHTKTHFHFITHTQAYRAGQEHTYHIGPSQGTCHTHTHMHTKALQPAIRRDACTTDVEMCYHFLIFTWRTRRWIWVFSSILVDEDWEIEVTLLDGSVCSEERTLHSDSLLIKWAASCLALFEQCSAFTANDRLLYSCIWWGRYWN